MALLEERMRLTGASVSEATGSLTVGLSEQDRARLIEEIMQRAFGDNQEKRDEAMRQAMILAQQ
jgi:hypothetical protein